MCCLFLSWQPPGIISQVPLLLPGSRPAGPGTSRPTLPGGEMRSGGRTLDVRAAGSALSPLAMQIRLADVRAGSRAPSGGRSYTFSPSGAPAKSTRAGIWQRYGKQSSGRPAALAESSRSRRRVAAHALAGDWMRRFVVFWCYRR